MLLLSLRGAVAAAPKTIDQPGTYEPLVAGLDPAVYLKFTETSGSFADNSGNGRTGTLKGTGAVGGVSALAPNVGATNKALNLGSAAWVEIPHAAADIALTTSYASPWDGDHTGNRFIADCTVSIWFKPNSLPTGSNKHVIVAKSSSAPPGVAASYTETHPMVATAGAVVPGGSWDAYIDANGAVHVEVRSFRGRPCRIRTPNNAVSAGTSYHLVVQLSYDGVAAWLDGAKFEDGFANLLHVYGLAANIRDIEFRNNYAWTIGRAAWGGQANLVVDEFAVFLRTPNDTISQANVNTLAQKSSTPSPLAHFIWGQRSVNRSSFASIQAAVDNVNSLGGGTVVINSGTYNENVVLKSNVRLKANSGTVTITGIVTTPTPSVANLGTGSGDFLTGARILTVSNSRTAGDVAVVRGLTNGVNGAATVMRHDRRWNTEGESNDASNSDGDCFVIESRTSTNMTFEGNGTVYDFAAGNRQEILAFTPNRWVAMEGITVNRTSGTCMRPWFIVNARFVNCSFLTVGDRANEVGRYSLYQTFRGCTMVNGDTTNTGSDNWIGESKDIVLKNITTGGGSRGVDFSATNANFIPTIRAEVHNMTDQASVGNEARYGAHSPGSDGIYWNINCNMGGFGVCGWKHDVRWTRQGLNGANNGALISNDGMGDCYYRDSTHVSPTKWFHAFEGAVGVDRCHFENLQRTGSTPGQQHVGMNYGTGAAVNTYRNVDSPHASWQEDD